MPRLVTYLALLVIAVVIGFAGMKFMQPTAQVGPQKQTATAITPKIGGPFSLIDHNAKPVTDKDYRGKYMLIFFGYTFCPDVCPTALSNVASALDELGPLAEKFQPIFISVDPDRDTPKILKDYVSAFHPQAIGLTGTADNIAAAAKAYRVYYAKVREEGTDKDDYLMDHSAIVYLMNTEGKFIGHFPHSISGEDMAKALKEKLSG